MEPVVPGAKLDVLVRLCDSKGSFYANHEVAHTALFGNEAVQRRKKNALVHQRFRVRENVGAGKRHGWPGPGFTFQGETSSLGLQGAPYGTFRRKLSKKNRYHDDPQFPLSHRQALISR